MDNTEKTDKLFAPQSTEKVRRTRVNANISEIESWFAGINSAMRSTREAVEKGYKGSFSFSGHFTLTNETGDVMVQEITTQGFMRG